MRAKDNTEIGLLVERGTIIYDIDGSASATGDAKILLDLAYGEEQEGVEGVEVRRFLLVLVLVLVLVLPIKV